MTSNVTYPHGSAPWMVTEQETINQFVIEEVENFSFKVRNQMDWLNGHMEEIFAPGNLNVLNTFKTPGKLRGRTPYTAKKRPINLNRTPLADIFAPNPQASSPIKSPIGKASVNFTIAEDAENQPYRLSPPKSLPSQIIAQSSPEAPQAETNINHDDQAQADTHTDPQSPLPTTLDVDRRRTTNETFVSAEEVLKQSERSNKIDSQATIPDEQPLFTSTEPETANYEHNQWQKDLPSENQEPEPLAEDPMEIDDVQSPSDASSPLKPVLRKSSLTFAALPAREPLAKTSFGPRTSHYDASKSFGGRASHLGRATGSRVTGGPSQLGMATAGLDKLDPDMKDLAVSSKDESEAAKLQNKTSTQRLHDKINMLGQSREIRTSKSQHLNPSVDKPLYPHISASETEKLQQNQPRSQTKDYLPQVRPVLDDDEDWILPISRAANEAIVPSSKEAQFTDQVSNRLAGIEPNAAKASPSRPFIHKKMASTIELESPARAAMAPDIATQKPISVSNPTPNLTNIGTTTPVGSPPRSPSGRKILDGPLSASKAKFYSVLKSAKGIFAISAGASVNAKIDAFSPGRSKRQLDEPLLSPSAEVRASPAFFPAREAPAQAPPSPVMEARRTRSSTEQKRKEEEQKRKDNDHVRKASDELERAREKERQKVAAIASSKMNQARPVSKLGAHRPGGLSRVDTASSKEAEDDVPPPPPPKTMLPTTQAQRLREQRRVPVPRSNKDAVSKVKPAPVTLRMPSQRLGQGAPSTALLNQSLHDTLPPPPPPKNAPTSKTAGLTAHANSSTTSVRSTVASAKRALDAAAKKKEQEVKVAQRKAEQKREMELKRAQRLEEEKRLEQQRKVAEQQRVQEARKAAQKQLEEKQRAEQQRKEAQRPVSRQNNLTGALHQEQSRPVQQIQRGDVPKPISKMNVVHDPQRPVVQMNPAKPPKRAMQFDDDDASQQRPAVQRNGPSYQQLDAKRRKTEDEDGPIEQERRSVMAPPVRHSTIKKETSKFQHPFMSSISGNQHHQNPSMFMKTVTAQHIQQTKGMQQNEMSKYANGRIPFADNGNPPVAASQSSQHKTPIRAGPSSAKKSPFYPNPDSIELPEIATDSEDDEDGDFVEPDWVASPMLRQALQAQQLVDPMEIFGPIEPLRMDEVFRNKERQKKFRDRTSSANWAGRDALTEEERARDRRARERLMADGGWDMRGQKDAMGSSPYPGTK